MCVWLCISRITWRSTQRTAECVWMHMNMYHSIHNIHIHSSNVDCRCSAGFDCDCDCDCGDCRHILSVCLFRCCQFSRIFCHQRRHALKLIAYDVGAEWGRRAGEGKADSGRRRSETDSISGRRRERDIFRSFHLFCMHTHMYTHTLTHACIHLWTHNVHLFVCFAVCFLPPALALVVLFLVRIWVPNCLAQHNPTVCVIFVCVCVGEVLSERRSVSLPSLSLPLSRSSSRLQTWNEEKQQLPEWNGKKGTDNRKHRRLYKA